MPRVTVVGSYLTAYVAELPRLPRGGETLAAARFRVTHGGKGSNMAVAARRLGAATRFVGCVGDDEAGHRARALLAAEDVEDGVTTSRAAPTGRGIVMTDVAGASAIVVHLGANAEVTRPWVEARAAAVRAGDVVLAPFEIPLAGALAAAAIAAAAGRTAIVNPAPACDLTAHDLRGIFALTPNETEARVCLGLPPDDPTPDEILAERLRALGPAHVVITRGARGALWADAQGLTAIPALAVDVVDTVGASDAFNAGLAVGLAEGRPFVACLALGVAAASLSTQAPDTVTSYVGRADVDARMDEVLDAARRL